MRNEVTHVDFIRVSRDEAVVVEVPIHFEGEASQVTSGGGTLDQQLFNLTVTNVPGPPRPLYALGARMLDMHPVVPLAGGQAVSLGVTSYDGGMYYGLTADRDAMPDVGVLAVAVTDALAELVGAARDAADGTDGTDTAVPDRA